MIYKKYEHPNFNVIGIKNNKFKSCQIEVVFRKNINNHDLAERTLLSDAMCYSTKSYPCKKDLVIRLQDLYNISVRASTNRLGGCLLTSFSVNFICPKYIKEKDFLDDVVRALFDVIFNPNITNHSFELNSFNTVKNLLLNDIDNIKEDPNKVAISNALNYAFKNSVSSYGLLKEKNHIKNISSDKLYDIYLDMINNDLCDIFVIGDLDLDKTNDLIGKYFSNRVIKTNNINFYVSNTLRRKPLMKREDCSFIQTTLVMIYNINDLNIRDLQITPYVFNNIFGNGTMNSKLFKYLREENSLCYGVSCIYLRFDGLLLIKVSLAKENVSAAVKLIKKALNEMIKGDFNLDQLEDAKKSSIFSIKMSEDYIGSLLNNYIFNYYDDLPLIDDRIGIVNKLTKSDVTSFAKHLKISAIYVLESGEEL